MPLADLRFVFGFLPLLLLITAFVPRKFKPALLAVGGAVYCVIAGWKNLLFAALSACIGWFSVRCCPRSMTGRKAAKAKAWICIDILAQLLLLFFAKSNFLLTLIPAVQSVCAIFDRVRGNLRAPSLLNYLSYCFSFPRIFGGIPLDLAERSEINSSPKVSIERIADGIGHIVVGLFKYNVLAIPVGRFYGMICSKEPTQFFTMLDAWLAALGIFFMLLYLLQSILEVGQGILLLLGYNVPDCFDAPNLASSLREFFQRLWTPMHRILSKILGITDENRDDMNILQWGIRVAAVLLPITFLLFDFSWNLVLFVILTLTLLIAERIAEQRKILDVIPQKVRIIITNLLAVILCFILFSGLTTGQFKDAFSLFGTGGFLLSPYAKYALSWYWSNLLLCILCALPIRKILKKLCEQHEKLEKASIIVIPLGELALLILSIMQILSSNAGL